MNSRFFFFGEPPHLGGQGLPLHAPHSGPAAFRARGFTIVELLVCIGIIGLLIALLMPATQKAREAGRRVTCQNNIRQVSLGIKLFEDSRKHLPYSGLVANAGFSGGYYEPELQFDGRSGVMQSWVVQILPFIEEGTLAKQIDPKISILKQPNDPQAKVLPTMLCPSETVNRSLFQHPTLTRNKPFAKGNYAAFVSPVHVEFQSHEPGALIADRKHRSGKFPDGAGKTMFLSEVRTRDNPRDQRGAWALPWAGSTLLAFDLHSENTYSGEFWGKVPHIRGSSYRPVSHSKGYTQLPNNPGPNMDMLYDCDNLADAQLTGMPCDNYSSSGGNNFLSAAPRSTHPGGVFVTFGDNSVKFLVDEVDEFTMGYLISINDGQIVNLQNAVR